MEGHKRDKRHKAKKQKIDKMDKEEMEKSNQVTEVNLKKKKKKKHRKDIEPPCVELTTNKHSPKGSAILPSSGGSDEDGESSKKARKKKKKAEDNDIEMGEEKCSKSVEEDRSITKNKHKRKSVSDAGATCQETSPVKSDKEATDTCDVVQCATEKKIKKHNKHSREFDDQVDNADAPVSKRQRKEHRSHEGSMSEGNVESPNASTECPLSAEDGEIKELKRKSNKHKKVHNDRNTNGTTVPFDYDNIHDSQGSQNVQDDADKSKTKKKKRSKSALCEVVAPEIPDEPTEVVVTREKRKKKKKDKKRESDAETSETNDRSVSPDSSSLVVSTATSEKAVAAPPTAAKFGQWGSAQFDSNDRQQKFLRLLGGFKPSAASSDLSGAPAAAAGVKANMAMDLSKQKQLNTALGHQYDRALNFHLGKQRGVGLGFAPPPGEGKKFYIDQGKSSSTKFND